MFDFISELFLALTWRKVLIGAALFLASFLVNLGIVSLILVKLPADHFSKSRKTKFWCGHFARGAWHRAVVAGRAGTRIAHSSSRYNVARLSRKRSVGTEVVKQTEYCEYD
jgi:hypothetical protein